MRVIKQSKIIGDNIVQIINEDGAVYVRATEFGRTEFARSRRLAGSVDALATYAEWVSNETIELAALCGMSAHEMPNFA